MLYEHINVPNNIYIPDTVLRNKTCLLSSLMCGRKNVYWKNNSALNVKFSTYPHLTYISHSMKCFSGIIGRGPSV